MQRIGFDLVGTLFVVRGRSPNVFKSAEPRHEIIRILKDEIANGNDVYVISARVGTKQTLIEVREALRRYEIPDYVPLLMQHDWKGVEAAIEFKTGMLKLLGIQIYYGDSERVDGIACKNANVRFVSVGGNN